MDSHQILPEYIVAPMGLRPMPENLAPEVHPLHGPYHRITWRAEAKSTYFPGEAWEEEYTYLQHFVHIGGRPIAVVWMRTDDEDDADAIAEVRELFNPSGEVRISRTLPSET